ncbi:DUF6198 family protein [bacterium 210917-SL.2.15]|nr:DUF6198 family protein [bacterium 210917-SL.2.15]
MDKSTVTGLLGKMERQGLAVNSFGIALMTKSALRTSQISSIPYVLSLRFEHVSFGTATFRMNMVFVVLELLLLRKHFHPVQFLQTPLTLIFSVAIGVSMAALRWYTPESLLLKTAGLLLGCVILAVGLAIELAPNVIVVPGEGIVRAIAQVRGREFGCVKVYFDLTLVLVALALSFLFSMACGAWGRGLWYRPFWWAGLCPSPTGMFP